MRYRLYNRIGSGGFVVEAALTLAGLPFELEELGSQAGTPLPASFGQTNPWRQLPTLILPDDGKMTETSAILIHIAACCPEKRLGPAPGSPEHATFLRWIIFANVNIYEAVARRIYPFRYTTDATGHDAIRAAATKRMGEALSVLESANAPGPFLLGERMSLADVYFAMLLIWFKGAIEAPHLATLIDTVRTHPVIGDIWRKHFGDRHMAVNLHGTP